jgi:hypothetical protein
MKDISMDKEKYKRAKARVEELKGLCFLASLTKSGKKRRLKKSWKRRKENE